MCECVCMNESEKFNTFMGISNDLIYDLISTEASRIRWSVKTFKKPGIRRRGAQLLLEKFVKINVCGGIIYAKCSLINYLWCVVAFVRYRKESSSSDASYFLASTLLYSLSLSVFLSSPFDIHLTILHCFPHDDIIKFGARSKKRRNQNCKVFGNRIWQMLHGILAATRTFSIKVKCTSFRFLLFKALFFITSYWLFRWLNAWMAAICLSASFLFTKALSNYLIFQSKLLKQIKKFFKWVPRTSTHINTHISCTHTQVEKWMRSEWNKKITHTHTMKMLKLLETHFKSMFYNKSTSIYNNNDLPKWQTASLSVRPQNRHCCSNGKHFPFTVGSLQLVSSRVIHFHSHWFSHLNFIVYKWRNHLVPLNLHQINRNKLWKFHHLHN